MGSSTGNGSPSAPYPSARNVRRGGQRRVRWTPCSPTNAVSSISAVGAERPTRTSPASAADLDQPADQPDRGADGEDRGQRAQRARRGGRRAVGRSRSGASRGSMRRRRRSARRRRPTAARARTRRRPTARSASSALSPPTTAKTSISSRTGTRRASPTRAGPAAARPRCGGAGGGSSARSRRAGSPPARSGWIRREPPISSPGSTIAVSSVPTACRNVSVISPTSAPDEPEDRRVRRDDRDQQPRDEDDPGRGAAAIAAATIPGSASRSSNSPACGSTRPIRSASGGLGLDPIVLQPSAALGTELRARADALAAVRAEDRVAHRSPSDPMGISCGRREGPDHQRHGGRRRHLALGPGERGQARLRGRPAALHRGDQRDRPGRVRRRRDRGRGDGLPRRGRRPLVQLADPRPLDARMRVRRADPLDRVHAIPRGRLRRRAVRRPARAAPAPTAACSATPSARPAGTSCASTARAVGEVGINAALCGTWGCPVALVTGDDVVCAEATELLGDGPAHARGQDRARPLQRPPPLPRDRPHAARAGGARGAQRPAAAPRSTTPGRRAPSPWSWPRPTTPTPIATAPA